LKLTFIHIYTFTFIHIYTFIFLYIIYNIHSQGEGVQHIAMFTRDIFATMRMMREASEFGGFEFQNAPPAAYYEKMPLRIGDSLTPEQYQMVHEMGILVDKDDQGVLLQIFTKPVGDRPTLFLEIIQVSVLECT
jgi:4-hydroxyphenylpyruvate dioxygenase